MDTGRSYALQQGIVPTVEQPAEPDCGYLPPDQPGGDPHGMSMRTRKIVTAVLVALAIICEFPLGMHFSSLDAYTNVNQTLDAQKSTTLGLVATATTASVAVSAIPDDVGTPIANQLADLSGKLAVVLSVIYLEKFLLTTFGLVGLRIFVPVGLGLLVAWLWTRSSWRPRQVLFTWAVKLAVVGLALVTLVPVSTGLTQAINDQYQTSLKAEETSQETDEMSATVYQENSDQDTDENQGILDWLGSAISSGVNALATGAADAANAVGEQLNKLIDAVAVSIVTSCLVPLAVLFLYFWLIKLLTGADFTGYVAKAQDAASASVRRAGATTRVISDRHCGSTSK